MSGRELFSIFVLLAATGLISCQAPAPEPVEPVIDVAEEAQAIRTISMQWLRAAQERDGAAVDAVFAPDAVSIFDGEVHEGIEELRAEREAQWAENPSASVSWSTTTVEVAASGDLAYERGSWTFDPDGEGDAAEEQGEYVTVYRKTDGQWRNI